MAPVDPRAEAAYRLSDSLEQGWRASPYMAGDPPPVGWTHTYQDDPPAFRRLSVFTQDPATVRADINVAAVTIPFEPLLPGPSGALVRVIDEDFTTRQRYRHVDLDGQHPAHDAGLGPSTTDPRFAQQMTYALAMATYERFRLALGRSPDFGFAPHAEDLSETDRVSLKLHIHPHAREEANAYYDRRSGALHFGYILAGSRAQGLEQPGNLVFSSLSQDVVIHEMTHAVLDGLRAHFMVPTNPDVPAFHEGFADLVAVFQRFHYRDLLVRAFEQTDEALTSGLLTDIARQFGRASGDGVTPLRKALLEAGGPEKAVQPKFLYDPDKEEHALSGVLVAAVFDAFRWIFEKKTKPLRQLAGNHGATRAREYAELLATEAGLLASQFTNVIVRAIDYCPPVDVTLGDYLRALVTADYDVVPDDPWCYREALVQGFRRYGIPVAGVLDLSEHALRWSPPERVIRVEKELAFPNLRFGPEPGEAPDRTELCRQGDLVGRLAIENSFYFGLAPYSRRTPDVEKPVVQSVRSIRRLGPDGNLNFDLVAEVTQRRRTADGGVMYGGSTIVFDHKGRVRYAICKHTGSRTREERSSRFLQRHPKYRGALGGATEDVGQFLKQLHSHREVDPPGLNSPMPGTT